MATSSERLCSEQLCSEQPEHDVAAFIVFMSDKQRLQCPITMAWCNCVGVPISTQMRDIQRGADVVVGTPGRVMDLQARGALDLRAVSHLSHQYYMRL